MKKIFILILILLSLTSCYSIYRFPNTVDINDYIILSEESYTFDTFKLRNHLRSLKIESNLVDDYIDSIKVVRRFSVEEKTTIEIMDDKNIRKKLKVEIHGLSDIEFPISELEYNKNTFFEEDLILEMFKIINKERTDRELNKLYWNEDLRPSADIRSKEITEVFSHTRPDNRQWHTVHRLANGENIAKGYFDAEGAMDGFMNSPGHRENILHKDFRSVSVSVYFKDNIYYYVQLFSVE